MRHCRQGSTVSSVHLDHCARLRKPVLPARQHPDHGQCACTGVLERDDRCGSLDPRPLSRHGCRRFNVLAQRDRSLNELHPILSATRHILSLLLPLALVLQHTALEDPPGSLICAKDWRLPRMRATTKCPRERFPPTTKRTGPPHSAQAIETIEQLSPKAIPDRKPHTHDHVPPTVFGLQEMSNSPNRQNAQDQPAQLHGPPLADYKPYQLFSQAIRIHGGLRDKSGIWICVSSFFLFFLPRVL